MGDRDQSTGYFQFRNSSKDGLYVWIFPTLVSLHPVGCSFFKICFDSGSKLVKLGRRQTLNELHFHPFHQLSSAGRSFWLTVSLSRFFKCQSLHFTSWCTTKRLFFRSILVVLSCLAQPLLRRSVSSGLQGYAIVSCQSGIIRTHCVPVPGIDSPLYPLSLSTFLLEV